MIEPTSKDIGRPVRLKAMPKATGRLSGFNQQYCYVENAQGSSPIVREALDWADATPAGPGESPRALAARSRLEAEGFAIEAADPGLWRIRGFTFWPEVGLWRHPDGTPGGNGVATLIAALRAQKPPPDAAAI